MSYVMRKFIAIAVALLMIVLSMPTAFAASDDLSNHQESKTLLSTGLTDISNHWASADIDKWVSKGLVKGYIDGSFKPDNPISRAEFAAIVNRVFGYTKRSGSSFKDVSAGAWYYEDISKAFAAGILKGDTSGRFRPEAPLSRQEAAIVIYRAFDLKAKDINSASRFSDANKISSWSKEAISAMAEGGYISGRGANAFGPLSDITRAESVKMLDSVVGELINAIGTYSENTETNLVVNTKDVNLKDMTIKGNLYITAGVGDGNISMDNVAVKGNMIVRGGGEHSIVIKNSTLAGTLIVFKEDGKIRIVSQGTTDIPQTQLNSGATLLDENSGGKGFGTVQVSQIIAVGQDIILDGDFLNVSIEAPSVNVQLLSGTVAKLEIQKTAVGATIEMAKGSTVGSFTANANVAVTGQGKIETANINANGVTIETKPIIVVLQSGITAVIEGNSTGGTPAPVTPPPSTGGNGSGDNGNGGNGGDNGSTPKSANSTVEKNSTAPNIEVVSQGDKEILVAEGTTVAQLLAQTKSKDGSAPRKAVAAENGDAKASGTLAKGDVLTVTSEDASSSSIYKIIPVKIEGKDGYWDGPLYRQIENIVKENIPVFKNVDYKITDEKYKALLKEMQEQYFIAGSASKSNPQYQTVTDYTQVFKKAIEECNANGGGRVVVPAREQPYYTGAIHLLSNVNLYIEEGATVKFVRNKTNEYYPLVLTRFEGVECMNFSPFIYAYGQENIGITGKGTLDGQCDAYNWIPWKTGSYGWANQSTLRASLFEMGNTNVPVAERILDDTISTLRPCFVEPYACKNVLIENFSVVNSPMWEIHPTMSENVMVRKLNINSKLANNDGVDPESCKNVIIEDCTIDTGDDCIAIKSGRDGDGRRVNVPSQNIIVRGNVFKKGHGGVTMGSEMSGSIRNILIEGNYFDSDELEYPLRFKTSAVRGGVIENIYLRNSSVNKSRQAIIRAEMTYEDTGDTGPYTPIIRNIGVSNFKTALPPEGDNNIQAARGIQITTVDRQPIENLWLKDCVFTGVAMTNNVENIANVMSVGRVKNLVFDNVEINGRIFNLEKVDASGITADDVALSESTEATIDTNSDTVKVTGYITTAMAAFTDGADVHVTVDKTASKAADTVFEAMGDGRIKFTANVPVSVGPHTVTVVAMARDKYNMDVKVFKVQKLKNGNGIPVALKKVTDSAFVTAVDNINLSIAATPGLTVESLLQNVTSATEYEYTYSVYDKEGVKKTAGLINSMDTLVVAPVAHPAYTITYKFEVYVEIRGNSTTSNTLFSTLTRSTPTTDFTTWSGSSTSSVPVLGTVRYVDAITKTTPEAVSVWFSLPGSIPVDGSYRAEVLEKLPAGNGAKVELYVNEQKIGREIDTQVTVGTDYTVTTNTFRKIDAGTANMVAGNVNCKFVFTGKSATSSNQSQNRIAVSYVRLYYVGSPVVLLSNGTIVVAKSGASDGIKVVGTSAVTVMNGTTVAEVKAQLAAKDGSVQTYAVLDGEDNAKASGAIAGGDKLHVTAADGVHTYNYDLAIYDPNAKAEDGVYWNEDLYNQIDKTVNANTPVFKNVYYNITDAKYAGLVKKVTETFYTGNVAGNPSNKTSPLVASSQEVWYYTDAIEAAIKDANEDGGGIVVVPATGSLNANGAYYSGAITLLSNVNLHVETGATIKFVRNQTNEYYPIVLSSYEGTDFYNYSPLIYALNQKNIAITGGGMLDGQEDMWNWRPWKKGYWGTLSVEEKTLTTFGNNGVLNDMNFRDVPITQRIFTDDGHMPDKIPVIDGNTVKYIAPPEGATALKSTFRPAFIEPYNCTNVIIEGVKIRNTPFWIIHPVSSENLLIRDLDIYSDKTKDFESGGWNNDDGLDPESCKNVVMERNHMTVSDDGGAIKAGRNLNGREHRNPSENIIIRNSIYNNDGGGSAAVSMGSEMSGSIRNVFVHDCEFGGPGLSLILKIKTNSNRGGMVENIYLRDCLLNQAISGMAQFDGNYSETVPFPNADMFNPTIRNIYIDNVNTAPTMTVGKTTFQFSSAASRSPVENVYYRNSVFYTTNTLQAAFNSNKNIKNFVVENVKYINPTTHAETMYNTTPLNLLDETAAVVSGGANVPLTAKSIANPDVIIEVPAKTFKISGKVDLSAYPGFTAGGTVRVFLDRSTSATNATLSADGSFITSSNITLNDSQYWYTDRHYVTVNFYNGYNMNSMVYQVRAKLSTETGIKLKASHANITELDTAAKTLLVTTGASVAQVLGQIESADGSVQTYAIKDASDAAKASGALVTGDKLVVTAADGITTAVYAITVEEPVVLLSNGTIVVAKSGGSDDIKVVGTSAVTVMNGTTVAEVKAQLAAKDGSAQTYAILDGADNAKASGAIAGGDKLHVTAADGVHTYNYDLAIYDPNAKAEDGVYWNEDLYNQIDKTVNANTPVFKNVYYNITDAKYAGLVKKVTETFYTGNVAGNPSNKTSPLVASSQEVWYYTDAIEAAIKDANEDGGGIVVVPATGSLNANGAYYSGAITLLSNVNLHVETGATIKFVRNQTNEYYPIVLSSYEGTDFYNYSPLIYALNQKNIAITGGGMLDGQEDMWNWRPWKKGYWGTLSVEEKTLTTFGNNGVLNDMNFRDVPITQRIFTDDGHMPDKIPVIDGNTVKYIAPPEGATALKSTFRPAFIEPYNCTNVIIEGVKIRNTPFWIIHPVSSENLLIRDLDIYSDKTKDFESGGWNNDDGLDPESCKNVVMERNHMTVSDDGGAIKAGRNLNGREHRNPSENIIIRNSIYNNDGGGSAAVSMGSEMSGSIRNVFVHDCEFGGPGLSLILKIKTNSNRGGMVENIYLRDCLLNQAISGMAQFDGNYSETVPFPNADMFNPTIRNIYIDNVNTAPTMTVGKTTFQFSSAASRSPVENVYYRNSVFYTTNTLQAAFNSNKNIKNFVVENVKYINPTTHAETMYNTTPLNLLDETAAVVSGGANVPLTAKSIANPDVIIEVPAKTFKISGKVDLSAYPGFTAGGTVRVFLDRSTSATNATLSADGSFITSSNITLNDSQYWYTDRHYVTVNFYNGYNMNSMVYQVRAKLSTETGIKLKASHANITELDTAAKTLLVTTGASVAQVLGQIESADGSVQTYAIKDASDAAKASGALVTGDKLVVTAADGVTSAVYAITVAKSSNTSIVAKAGAILIKAVTSSEVKVFPGTTVAGLVFEIKAEDNSLQTYAVTTSEGTAKESGVLATGDKLVVTAEDTINTSNYTITVETLSSDTNIAAKPGLNPDSSAYTGSPHIAAVDNAKRELYLYTAPASVEYVIAGLQPLAGTVEGQTYEIFDGSTKKNDADNVALQGDTLVVTAPDGVTKTTFVIRKRTLEFEEYASTTPAGWTFSGISLSSQLQEDKGYKYVQSSEGPDVGAYMAFEVTVPESGIYNVLMNCKYDTDPKAVIQISIDGTNVGDPFDLRGSSTDVNAPYSEQLAGRFTFADTGTHTFKIMVTQAAGNLILDYIDLVKAE